MKERTTMTSTGQVSLSLSELCAGLIFRRSDLP